MDVAGDNEYGLYLNIGTILGLVGAVATFVNKIWSIERTIREAGAAKDEELRTEMEAKFENVARDVKSLERDTVGRAEILRHETGEVGAALRQKIHEFEVFSRDNFVNKSTFENIIGRLENSIDRLGERLETKIDRVLSRRD